MSEKITFPFSPIDASLSAEGDAVILTGDNDGIPINILLRWHDIGQLQALLESAALAGRAHRAKLGIPEGPDSQKDGLKVTIAENIDMATADGLAVLIIHSGGAHQAFGLTTTPDPRSNKSQAGAVSEWLRSVDRR